MSATKYVQPSLTADIVVFSLDDAGRLCVLLIQRGREPFAGRWAIPGGFCEAGESVEQSAARELQEETGLSGLPLEELKVYSAPGRDPRGWVVSVAHVSVLPRDRRKEALGADDAREARWWSVEREGEAIRLVHEGAEAGSLAFDHDQILKAALARLAARADALALGMLSAPFTLEEARRAFEAALGRSLDAVAFGTELFEKGLVQRVPGPVRGQVRYEVVSARGA
jgi:8-oxo-dGTP diphosphatase